MTNTRPRHHPQEQRTTVSRPEQKTIDGGGDGDGGGGTLKRPALGYLTESFLLNSVNRRVNRRGNARPPTAGSQLLPWTGGRTSGGRLSVLT